MAAERNPDVYLLYEYMDKISLTVRIKVILKDDIDAQMLREAAQESIQRFPYFSVCVNLDDEENYILCPNTNPIPVIPEEDGRIPLGSKELGGHLFAISWKEDTVWFNFAHSVCGAFGVMPWIKTMLYHYMTRKYGEMEPPADLREVGTPLLEGELAWPDADRLPKDEPVARYTGGSTNVGIVRMLKFLLNPFAHDTYYYQVEIPADAFMQYAKEKDGTPNTVLTAMIFKAAARHFKEKKGQHLSVRIAMDYRRDVGCPESYRDFVRLLHAKYDWSMMDEPMEKLVLRARGAVIVQSQPELSYERFRHTEEVRRNIDSQKTLKEKIKYASSHSAFRSDERDTCSVSYVGKVDFGQMAEYIRGMYTITDGDMILEVNALPDRFCICLQMADGKRELVDRFCEVMKEEKLPFSISDRLVRSLPAITLPKAK